MLEADPSFRPVDRRDGYLALEDMGLIGDGTTSALVGLDGSIPWLCLPRFDSEPLFCGLLDHARGGGFTVAPDVVIEARQRYEPDTAVLVTELRSPTGLLAVTDALALRPGTDLSDDASAGRRELIRSAVVLAGSVRVRVEIDPRGGASAQPAAGGLRVNAWRLPDLDLHVRCNRPLGELRSVHELHAGEGLDVVLSWGGVHRHHRFDEKELLAATAESWRRWMRGFEYEGPEAALVRRAALTLKLCDHWSNGALIAAPTSSLPAPIGGVRNWDYRYTWIRDASFSVYALRRIGFAEEAGAFLGWVLDTFERGGAPKIMYKLDGGTVPDEVVDGELEGYRRSVPVRWGNGAADQRQHDVYGEVLDCAYQWFRGGGQLDEHLWGRLAALADLASDAWRLPDQGIWEVRSEGRVFTYSAGLCQVALDRAARLAKHLNLPGPVSKWQRASAALRDAVLGSWDEDAQTLSEHLDGGGSLDASLLALPMRRVVPAEHPRMVATTAAVTQRLSAGGGLLYRYLHERSPDGLPGDEGAFVLCSFWLVENLAKQGRLDEAAELYASLCGRASSVGLLPEQIDPSSGEFAGNFPQAFSHIGVIAAGVTLARTMLGSGIRQCPPLSAGGCSRKDGAAASIPLPSPTSTEGAEMPDPLYTAKAHVTGGRAEGHGRSSDGVLDLDLRLPVEMGGEGGGTNPEELFAVGYAACFEGALGIAGRRTKVETGDVAIDSEVSLSPNGSGGFSLGVRLDVTLPSVSDPAVAVEVVREAHGICPYSNATRGNIDVVLSANGQPVE